MTTEIENTTPPVRQNRSSEGTINGMLGRFPRGFITEGSAIWQNVARCDSNPRRLAAYRSAAAFSLANE